VAGNGRSRRTVTAFLSVVERGLLADIETMNLDRGYDNRLVRGYCAEIGIDDLVCARKRKRGTAKKKLAGVARDALARGADQQLVLQLRATTPQH
jgi:hypothetical protein